MFSGTVIHCYGLEISQGYGQMIISDQIAACMVLAHPSCEARLVI